MHINELNEYIIRKNIGEPDFTRGKAYYKNKIITNFTYRENEGSLIFDCLVKGTGTYTVSGEWDGKHLRGECSCIRFSDCGVCKHLAAAFLLLAELTAPKTEKSPVSTFSDGIIQSEAFAQNLIKKFIDSSYKSARGSLSEQCVELHPKFSFSYDSYPEITFDIGTTRLYRVRDLNELLSRINDGAVYQYRKSEASIVNHRLSSFDEASQKLISILQNVMTQYKNMSLQSVWYSGGWSYNSKDNVIITGESFKQILELYANIGIENNETKKLIAIKKEDPVLELEFIKGTDGISIMLDTDDNLRFFGTGRYLYGYTTNAIYCCSDSFYENVSPIASQVPFGFRIGEAELPTFCSSVIPKLRPYINITDSDDILSGYSPDSCTICYYFDSPDMSVLTVKIAAHYEQRDIPCDTDGEYNEIKRDREKEHKALLPLEGCFEQINSNSTYSLSANIDLYDFLSERIEKFHEYGEVYLSDKLRKYKITSHTAQAGVSVSDGILTLNLNIGEFPAEELEALYQSLIQKRKYHKLKDGRYLTLDGSPYEALAEAAHMMQLSPKDLKNGRATMPAFRGLYLDSILGQSSGVQVERERSFRELLRNFKAFEDSDYAVPEQLEEILRPYQKTGFRWLKTLESYGFGGILADEMGLGKTLQVIACLLSSREKLKEHPALIVCPTSLLINWNDECARFAPKLTVKLIMGDVRTREELLGDTAGDVWVTSYDLLKRDIEKYEGKKFSCCVLDEGQFVKNKSTIASKAVKSINCSWRLVLTGTPIENRLSELWNLFDFMMPGYLFTNTVFVDKLEKPIIKSGDTAAREQLSKLIRPFLLRRLKKDVLKELPGKIEHIHRIALSDEERKIYSAEAHYALNVAKTESNKIQILALLTRLRRICCAPGLCYENYEGDSSKLDACIDLCSSMIENGHQILLFSQFTSALTLIAERLDKLSVSYFILDGSTSGKERARLVKAFQQGEASIFLISLKAGGTGLNLTAADVVIHYDPWWNMAAQNQATDRAHRIGQESHVNVYQLIAKDTIEEKIIELQEKKAELMDTVIGGNESGILAISHDELIELLEH